MNDKVVVVCNIEKYKDAFEEAFITEEEPVE